MSKKSPATPAPIPTGKYRLVFEQGATIIPLTDWGTFKTRSLAQQGLADLLRKYRANGAAMTGDSPLNADTMSVALKRYDSITGKLRFFTLKIAPVYHGE